MLAPEGTRSIAAAAAAGLALAGAGAALGGWGWGLAAAGAALAGGSLWSYRDPERTPPPGADRLLLAPADGRVVAIDTDREPHYLRGPARRVTIALSPLDVRVGRSPATGTVELAETGPGDGGDRGPVCRVGLRHDAGVPVLVTRTAGLFGRPPRPDAEAGARASAGERSGLAPAGAHVHVAVPPDVELDVELGQRTVAGETVIGRLPSSAFGDGLGRLSEAPLLHVT